MKNEGGRRRRKKKVAAGFLKKNERQVVHITEGDSPNLSNDTSFTINPDARAQTTAFMRERQLQTEQTTRRFLFIRMTSRLIHTNDASFDYTHKRQCIQTPEDTLFGPNAPTTGRSTPILQMFIFFIFQLFLT